MSNQKIWNSPYAQRSFRIFAMLMMMCSATSVLAQDGATLRWELVNPFRFIRERSYVDELRRVYDGLSADQKTAYALERELQRLSDEEVDTRRAAARMTLNCDHPNEVEKRRCFEPYAGWFARLAKDNYSATCWNSVTQSFRSDVAGCRDYVYPESHRVRVWIENGEPFVGLATATWFVNNQPLLDTNYDVCNARYQKAFCIELSVPFAERSQVSVSLSNGHAIGPMPVVVVDKLIVGLGDSYASGEGNPDRPAQFTQGETEKDVLPALLSLNFPAAIKGTKHPRKDTFDDAAVSWLDERCHRSMYSYQFKTALQLALSNPQEAITYISYSCSGATTDQIIKNKKKAIEGGGKVDAQLDSLRQVLSNKKAETREIDYLLLSTGGNDIGFAKFVTYVVLSGKALTLYKLKVNEQKMVKGSEKGKFRKTLLGSETGKGGNYVKLNNAIFNTVPGESSGIRVKGCKAGAPCEHILLTPYPNVLNNEDNQLCRADRAEFDNPFGVDTSRESRIKTLNTYVFQQLRDVQRRINHNLGWTVVNSNVDAYVGHGFCAQAVQEPIPVEEIFALPVWKDGKWTLFQPSEYKPYAARLRWIRLPIDAKLTTDQMHDVLGKFNIDFLLEDDRSNIMHPTAEGHAKTADANVVEIRRLETAQISSKRKS